MNSHPIGAVVVRDGDIELSPGRQRRSLVISNATPQPIRIGCHYPLWLVNRGMVLDRQAAWGYHLDIPAGASQLWEPRETRTVELVAFAGTIGAELAKRVTT